VNKLNWVRDNGEPGKNYVITVTGNETIDPYTITAGTSPAPTGFAGACVTLVSGGGEREISLQDGGASELFTLYGVNAAQKVSLVLGNGITLKGRQTNAPLIRIGNKAQVTMLAYSKITGNTVLWATTGAGVYVNGGTFVMRGGKISDNTGSNTAGGAGVYVDGNALNTAFIMTGGDIMHNTSGTGGGGGVYAFNCTFVMLGGNIKNNTSTGHGGGVLSYSSTFTMSNSEISDNSADRNGGGVYISGGEFTMSNSTISDNNALNTTYGNGGGVYAADCTFTMSGSAIAGNTANSKGGGVYTSGGGYTFTMLNSAINGNAASNGAGGGGVYINEGVFTMSGGEMLNNYAYGRPTSGIGGGGVYVRGVFMLQGGTLSGNIAPLLNGGAVYVDSGAYTFTMSGGEILGSVADKGGAVYVNAASNNSRFVKSGGAIYDNNALSGSGNGHAAYYTKNPSTVKYRDTNAGPAVPLDTTDSTGWE
jgi:hypothetical protein